MIETSLVEVHGQRLVPSLRDPCGRCPVAQLEGLLHVALHAGGEAGQGVGPTDHLPIVQPLRQLQGLLGLSAGGGSVHGPVRGVAAIQQRKQPVMAIQLRQQVVQDRDGGGQASYLDQRLGLPKVDSATEVSLILRHQLQRLFV